MSLRARVIIPVLIAAAAPGPLRAQLVERQAPDSVQQLRIDILTAMRDTLASIGAQLALVERGTRAGNETVMANAASLRAACTAALDGLAAHNTEFSAVPLPASSRRARANADSLRLGLAELRRALMAECVTGFAAEGPGSRADSIRAWTPYRANQIRRATQTYNGRISAMAQALDAQLVPRGVRRTG